MTPDAIGPYRVVRQLGEGGQGVVYLGEARDGTPVAIKVLREGISGDGRFAKEIAAARRVEPFCIAQVLDASLGARPYIVTEFVDGPSLHAAGRHSGSDLQRLAVATATALVAIHRAGVVHRDFKPANVLLGRDGPRVIDFGIARAMDDSVTRTSSIVGTPAYMAPEQFAGAPVGPPSDVFAWASVMVFAATGTPPFGNDSVVGVLRRIQYEEPQLADVPAPLRSIVYACLAKDPRARPTMQDVLFRLIGAQPSPAQHPANQPIGTPPQASFPPQAPFPPPPGQPSSPGSPFPGSPFPGGPLSGGPGSSPFPGGPGGSQFPGGPGQTGPGRQFAASHLSPDDTHAPSRNRYLTALLTGGAAMVVTGSLIAAWAWSPLGRSEEPNTAAIVTGEPSEAETPKPTKTTKRTETAKTPKPTRSSTRPPKDEDKDPTPQNPTPQEPTEQPTKKPTTAKPKTATAAVKGISFRYEGYQRNGCWRHDTNIWATVSTTGTYSYRWLVNGQNQGRQQGTPGKEALLPSIVWKGNGTYRVALEVITPASARKSVTVRICVPEFDDPW
ncbi:serine/threonine protein kinase [Nonomuraea purpurea]|uniref:non-specific serine/threonine protein kinase n=1 Tax=Nonomuraea purpurea TaxID=1849276 RepID=A0ABV8G259_9ACTN